jgi:pimeloyl-ACP methyl ester carboxylesterase
MPEFLIHNRIRLALHDLRGGQGRPLLLLHGLGERSPRSAPAEYAAWPGPLYALDFSGHGESTVPRGGGYTCEMLMADADAAIARLGEATLVGRGLGAYVALLIAGGRPQQVRGAILRDGPGLAGGGSQPASSYVPFVDPAQPSPPDPFALAELAIDIRPPDYAAIFARQAAQFSGLSRPISLCASERPGWLAAVASELGVEVTTVDEALAFYAGEARG